MGFFSNQASYGPPAQAPYIEPPIELEAQAQEYQQEAKLSYLNGLNLPKVDKLKLPFDIKLYNETFGGINNKIKLLSEKIYNSSGILDNETKSEARQLKAEIQSLTQEGGAAYILQKRYNKYTNRIKAINENKEMNNTRKQDLIYFTNKSVSEDDSVDFYMPDLIINTNYQEEAIKTAEGITPTDNPAKQTAYLSSKFPGLTLGQKILIEKSLTDERTPQRIMEVVMNILQTDSKYAADIQFDTDKATYSQFENIKDKSDPQSINYDPNFSIQYSKDKDLIWDTYNNKIYEPEDYTNKLGEENKNEIIYNTAAIAAEAKRTQKFDISGSITQTPEWAMGIGERTLKPSDFYIPGLTGLEAKPESFDKALKLFVENNNKNDFISNILDFFMPTLKSMKDKVKKEYIEVAKAYDKILGKGQFGLEMENMIKFNNAKYEAERGRINAAAISNPSMYGYGIIKDIIHSISNNTLITLKDNYNMYQNIELPGAKNILKLYKAENESPEKKIEIISKHLKNWQKEGINQEYLTAEASKSATQHMLNLSAKYFGMPSQNGLVNTFTPSGLFMERTFINDKGESELGIDLFNKLDPNKKHSFQFVGPGTGENIYKDSNWQQAKFGASKGLQRIGIDGKFYWMEGDELDKLYMYVESQLRLADNYAGGIVEDEKGNIIPVLKEQRENKIMIEYFSNKDLSTNQYNVITNVIDSTGKIINIETNIVSDPMDVYNSLHEIEE